MYNNGQCYIWIPSALTLNKLTTETAAIVNAVHTALSLPTVSAGQTNPYYLDLNDLDMGGAPFTRDAEPGLAVCGPIQNVAYLTPQYAQLIVAFGAVAAQMLGIGAGDIEGMPVFFELDSLSGEVPASFPGRTYTTGTIGNEVTHVHTWETWGVVGESHRSQLIGDKYYRSSNYGQAGTTLHASEWANAGLTVKTVAEYQAIVTANATPMP